MINTFVALDIETTGLVPDQDKIIEIGAIKYIDGEVIEEFKRLINPKRKLSQKITDITGIYDEMLNMQPDEDEVIPEFVKFLGNHIILGHNILFDFSFIKAYMIRKKETFSVSGIDTFYLSKILHKDLRSKSLQSMCNHYHIHNEHAHRALDDAKAASKLYFALYETFGQNNNELFTPKPLNYKLPKIQPITKKQKNYLLDLAKYHKINTQSVLCGNTSVDELTKSQASRIIDKIILKYGRIL